MLSWSNLQNFNWFICHISANNVFPSLRLHIHKNLHKFTLFTVECVEEIVFIDRNCKETGFIYSCLLTYYLLWQVIQTLCWFISAQYLLSISPSFLYMCACRKMNVINRWGKFPLVRTIFVEISLVLFRIFSVNSQMYSRF